MNVDQFVTAFDDLFPATERDVPTPVFEQRLTRSFFDPCPEIQGLTAVKNQFMLKLAYSCLPENECYFEVGIYCGKTLISALKDAPARKTYACDDFSEAALDSDMALSMVLENLQRYGLRDRVEFFNADFRTVANASHIGEPIGLYFYDGGHTEEDQRDAITLVAPLLADTALVIVDDWNFPEVPTGTQRGIEESEGTWERLYVLPARHGEDTGMWWNGVAIYAFRR